MGSLLLMPKRQRYDCFLPLVEITQRSLAYGYLLRIGAIVSQLAQPSSLEYLANLAITAAHQPTAYAAIRADAPRHVNLDDRDPYHLTHQTPHMPLRLRCWCNQHGATITREPNGDEAARAWSRGPTWLSPPGGRAPQNRWQMFLLTRVACAPVRRSGVPPVRLRSRVRSGDSHPCNPFSL